MSEIKKTMFDELWEMKEDEFDSEEKALKFNEMKRGFETSYDKAVDYIIKLKRNQQNLLKDRFKNFDLNGFRENKSAIEDYENAKKEIAELYEQFFGEKIKR